MSAIASPAGDQHRDIDQDPASVMDRGEPAAGHRPGQGTGQTDPVRPTRSASSRVATFPACATTPPPSAETTSPVDHDRPPQTALRRARRADFFGDRPVVLFTGEVPSTRAC